MLLTNTRLLSRMDIEFIAQIANLVYSHTPEFSSILSVRLNIMKKESIAY